jgi:putative ABC transport system permease protein
MIFFRQIYFVSCIGLAGLPQRLGSSLVMVIGIASVVSVLVSVLAMAVGFTETATRSGRIDRAVVLGGAAQSEAVSNLTREAALSIVNAPGVKKTAENKPIASRELLAALRMESKKAGAEVIGMLRGVSDEAFLLRPEMRLVEGRMFRPARNELIIGKAAQSRLAGSKIGDSIKMSGSEWTIVGVFESNGDSHESEMLSDVGGVQSAIRGNRFSSVTVLLESSEKYAMFKDALTKDLTLKVDVKTELQYLEESSGLMGGLLKAIAYGIGSIMALGAICGAINAMYSTVSKRSIEIGVLKAIGFSPVPVLVSVIVEALLLALVGAVVGAGIAWLFFNGDPISTITGNSPSQVTYSLRVSPALIGLGVSIAIVIGLIGGLPPAIRAAKVSVTRAIKNV